MWGNRAKVLEARLEIMRKQLDELLNERQNRLCAEGKHLAGELRGDEPGHYWVKCPHCWKDLTREKK